LKGRAWTANLRDIFGWSSGLREADLDPALLALMQDGGCVVARSRRVALHNAGLDRARRLFLHSAFPANARTRSSWDPTVTGSPT
jgi:hypothetical protein